MSGPLGSQQWMYSTGFYPHEIDQSLRFNDDDSAYLSRTPASAGNRKTWTWSGWFKRANISVDQVLFSCYFANNDSSQFNIRFNSSNQFVIGLYNPFILISNDVFRDVSAWYHIVVALDTTEAASADRLTVTINNRVLSSFSTDNRSLLTLNGDFSVNAAQTHTLGFGQFGTTYADGYMAEVNFIDGQALDASSFGENKSGVWIPKPYSGSYGTNGFYLDFGNSGSLGADSSGNGNNWTPNNLAATDQVLDSPTNNFATLNPLYQSLLTYSEGNLRTYYGGAYAGAEPTMYTGKNEKYYSEELLVSLGGDRGIAVIADNGTESIGWVYNGNTYGSLAAGFVMPTYTTGDIIGYAIDGTTNQVQFYKNGVAAGSAWQFSTTAPLGFRTHMGYMYGGSDAVANFGQDSSFAGQKTAQGYTDANGIGDFYYQPPSGYLALCTANLPDPVAAIDPALGSNPEDHFNTVLYTGDGSTLASGGQDVTGVGFDPDIVWLKHRNEANDHHLYDQVRGDYKRLFPSFTDAESSGGRLSFITDGFNVSDYDSHNKLNGSFVAWNWKAGGTGVTNTDGTITSTVSANVDAGFSIIGYTGTGSDGTVGHGLSQTPDLFILKNRDDTSAWYVYTTAIDGSMDYLSLNTTDAKGDSGLTAPTSTVISVGGSQAGSSTSGEDQIIYAFHSVDGFSKIDLYTGNGSTDGPFVYTGFRPAFVMVKNSSGANDWITWDALRNSYNIVDSKLSANTSSAEFTSSGAVGVDFLSNGFKIKGTDNAVNDASNTYIYMAFAEMPFKYSTAR